MKIISKIILLLLVLSFSGCGSLPSRYDQIALDCGDLANGSAADSGHVIMVLRDGNSYEPARISAKWYERGSETPIKVSSKGCVPTPKSPGILKLVSDDRKFAISLDLPQSQSLTVLKQTLKPLSSANFKISCQDPLLLRNAADFSLALEWEVLGEDDFWQINQLRYQIVQEGQAIAESSLLVDAKNPKQGELALGPLQLKDGRYALTAQARTIAGDAVNAANSCSFDLDQTAPDQSTILGSRISPAESPLPLNIGSGSDQHYYCISGENQKQCEDVEQYKIATEFVASQTFGAQVLYSYSMDAAGNRSVVSAEPFFRDVSAPSIQLLWLNHHLRQGLNWAVEPNQTFAFQVSVEDDSVASSFMKSSELLENTVCRVSYVDQAGGQFSATQALCTGGSCEGKTMDSWVPCDGLIKFQFQDDGLHTLFHSQVRVEVKTEDLANRQSNAAADFWVNPNAFSSWQNTKIDLPFQETQLNFVNDNFGRFLAFSNSIKGPNKIHPTLFFKDSENAEWSQPLAIQSNDLSIFALREQNLLLTRSLKPESKSDSLWLIAGTPDPTLMEVPLANETRGRDLGPLQAQAYPIPASMLAHLGEPGLFERRAIQGITEFHDAQGIRKLLILLSRLDGFDTTLSFVFISFDGKDFALIADSDNIFPSTIYTAGPGLMKGPRNLVTMLINNQLTVFDPNQGKLSFPTLNPLPKFGLRSLYKDRKGFYGLTGREVKPFALTFNDDASSATLEILQADEVLKGIRDINHLVRKSDGSFWLSALSGSNAPVLFSWKPWSPSRTGWLLQDSIWNWSTAVTNIWSFGLGIDENLDQLALTTLADASTGPNRLTLRMMQNNNFIEVSDQGLYRAGLQTRPTQQILLAQDKLGNLVRLSSWRTTQDGYLAVSKLGDSGPAKNISLKPLVGGSNFAIASAISSMTVDRDGAVWFEDTLSGEVKLLDLNKGAFLPQFELTPATSKWRMFDSQGNYWGSLGRDFTEIQLRRPDNSRRIFKLAEGFQGERIIWNEPKSWILARHRVNGSSRLFELDLQRETIRDDRQLDQDDFSFADIIPFQGKRLALVRASRVNGEDLGDLAQLKLYEDDGDKWVEWDNSLQPKWPDWHPMAQQAILVKDDRTTETKLFYEPGVIWIASTGVDPKLPILARMPLDSKTWTVFNPSTETVKSPVKGFWLDPQNRLVLSTAAKIFYYNPTNSNQDKWMSIGP